MQNLIPNNELPYASFKNKVFEPNFLTSKIQLDSIQNKAKQTQKIKQSLDLFIDYPLCGIAHQPDNSLHKAAYTGDIEILQSLLDSGFDVNATDIFGCTPLHIAALKGNAETIGFLIEHGAQINAISNHIGMPTRFTPLDFAVMLSCDVESIQLLAQQGGESYDWDTLLDVMLTTIFESTEDEVTLQALDALETLALHTPNALFFVGDSELTPIAVILQTLSEIQGSDIVAARAHQVSELFFEKDIYNLAQNYLTAKNLLLNFPSDEVYKFYAGDLSHYILAEGHYGSYSAQFATKSLEQFIIDFKNLNQSETSNEWNAYQPYQLAAYSTVLDAFQLGLDTVLTYGSASGGEHFYDLYQQGQSFVIPTGWENHAIDLVFVPEYNFYAIANAGMMYYDFIPGFNAYSHQYEISPEVFSNLIVNTSEFELEFNMYYELGSWHVPEYSFATEPQSFGNCSWYSQLVAEQGLLFIESLKITNDYSQALKLSEYWFNELHEYQKTFALQEYLEQPSLEIAALQDILDNFHQDVEANSYGQQRVDMLIEYIDQHSLINDSSHHSLHPVSEPLHNFAQTESEEWLQCIEPKSSQHTLELHDVIFIDEPPVLWEDSAPLPVAQNTIESAEFSLIYQPIVVEDNSLTVF